MEDTTKKPDGIDTYDLCTMLCHNLLGWQDNSFLSQTWVGGERVICPGGIYPQSNNNREVCMDMAEFKVVIGDTKTGKSYSTKVEGQHANALIGKKIGDVVDGIFVGLPGYKVQITGGSDFSGFPMRPNLPGSAKKRILVTGGVGFKSHKKGLRKKKTMRGNTISPDIVSINVKIVQHGNKPIEELLKTEEEGK